MALVLALFLRGQLKLCGYELNLTNESVIERPFWSNMVDWNYPKTVVEAVARLESELPLKYKVYIASLNRKDLHLIYPSLNSHIGQEYGLYTGNRKLIQSCRTVSGIPNLDPEQCTGVIIEELWKNLKKTHPLRIVTNGKK